MDLSTLVNTQFAIPVGVASVCVVLAILVYAFGFKSAAEPTFEQLTILTSDDRKPAGKKRRLKDKKSQPNGHATAVSEASAEVKTTSAKPAAKVEKSPAKEATKPAAKLQKKQESSPLKDKPIAKQKDNKNEAESTPKQGKEKKQEIIKKSPGKENNSKNASNNQKAKGKENLVEETKNQKNAKNLAKLKKAEGKPPGFDDGGWKEVLSSKDKKSRKKDEPEEIIPVKSSPKNEGTPKKKKSKNIELVMSAPEKTVENKEIVEEKEIEKEEPKAAEKPKKAEKQTEKKKPEEKKKSEKQNEKKKKVEQESEKEVEEKKGVVEVEVVAETKSTAESTPDAGKSKKKNKKKPEGKDAAEVAQPVLAPKKVSESSEKPVEVKKVEVAVEPAEAIFDELGDTWKEAKVPKKSKKKVRKDQ